MHNCAINPTTDYFWDQEQNYYTTNYAASIRSPGVQCGLVRRKLLVYLYFFVIQTERKYTFDYIETF